MALLIGTRRGAVTSSAKELIEGDFCSGAKFVSLRVLLIVALEDLE